MEPMATQKVKPSLALLLIPAVVSAALIFAIVMSILSIGKAFAPMIEINPPENSLLLEETGTYYVYKLDTPFYEDFDWPDQITILDPNGGNIRFTFTNSNSTMTINNRSYQLIGSFEIATPGQYNFTINGVQLYLSKTSVGGMVGSIFGLVGGILGLVFFNLIFLIIFFVLRARNRRRLNAETFGRQGNYPGTPGGYGYNPYYGRQGYPPPPPPYGR